MHKKKSLFITFEGIEGSGKSYQIKKLQKNLKKKNISSLLTREPGGTESGELIRKIILNGKKNKFTGKTDTLLYLASRNEHIEKKIKSSIKKNKIVICDRFIDSTKAYQCYGKNVNESLVDSVHKYILNDIKPDITFLLTVTLKTSFERIKKRKVKNRYDKFDKSFYNKVQRGFIAIAKKNKKRFFIIDNSKNSNNVEKVIINKVIKLLKK